MLIFSVLKAFKLILVHTTTHILPTYTTHTTHTLINTRALIQTHTHTLTDIHAHTTRTQPHTHIHYAHTLECVCVNVSD